MRFKSPSIQYFLLLTYLFIISGLLVCIFNDKIALHLNIIKHHSYFWDIFFKNITYIGDGAFALILLPFLLFYAKARTFILSVLTCLLAGVFAQFFKKIIFIDAYRPSKLIASEHLHLIDGVHLHSSHAFPSGHTTSAFAFFILLSFLFARNKFSQILFALLAILVGFSRVYISQHFLGDVMFGASLGIVGFLTSQYIVDNMSYRFLNKTMAEIVFPRNKRLARIKARV